jgi:transcriptional regulator with XRE-family HTH domain
LEYAKFITINTKIFMSVVSDNIKYLRKQMHFTQEQMAGKIGIKRSLLGAYEEGRADPRLNNLQKMADIFNVSVDMIINDDLTKLPVNELHKNVREQGFKVLAITTDHKGNENIELVPQKASAGYLNGFADPEYLEELPKFNIPGLSREFTYRAFEITGDSMLPLQSGTIIIGKYLQRLTEVKDGKTYVFLTKSEGIVYKRAYSDIAGKKMNLVSDNPVYQPYAISYTEILEIWEAVLFISGDFPQSEKDKIKDDISFAKLKTMVLDLQEEVLKLKK